MPEPADRPPSGCRYCGHPERGHAQRWTESVHWHVWHPPTDAQTKQRMLARRADRITARAAQYEQPSSLRDQIAQALYEWAVGHTTGGARFLAGGTDKPLRENSLARADAVLPVVEPAMLAIEVDATQRADELAARLEQALDQIATERRGKLTAEAAVRRVRALIDSYPPGSQFARSGAQALFRAALDAEQPAPSAARSAATGSNWPEPADIPWTGPGDLADWERDLLQRQNREETR